MKGPPGNRSCAYHLCHPNVLTMKTAEPCDGSDTPNCLHRSMERSILIKRKVRSRLIVVGRIICQKLAKVPFPEHHDMVEALKSDRANQPFNMTILPR